MEIDYKKRQREARLKEICGKHVYPWLISLGGYAKKNGIYPMSFCDLYTDPRDKEIAAVIEIGIPMKRREQYFTEYRNILGGSLYDKVMKRDFMELSDYDRILGAVLFSTHSLFNILDWVWSVTVESRVPLEHAILGELGITKKRHSLPITQAIDFSDLRYRMEMALAKMTLRDGYGCGLWDFLEEDELPLPVNAGMKRMLRSFYPIVPPVEPQEMMRFMGIKKPKDMLYVYWGYEWAKKLHTSTVDSLQKKVRKQYLSCEINGELEVPKTLKVSGR